jgi:hypothetical protein
LGCLSSPVGGRPSGLWREGHQDVLRRAEGVGLVEGTRWSEDAIGTNAMGTALAEDRALRIHSAEHHVRAYHPWTCAAAPIHDPGGRSGAVGEGHLLRLHRPGERRRPQELARVQVGRLAGPAEAVRPGPWAATVLRAVTDLSSFFYSRP